jgi:hypothetical protein
MINLLKLFQYYYIYAEIINNKLLNTFFFFNGIVGICYMV